MELFMLISTLIFFHSSSLANCCIPQEAQLLLNVKHIILRHQHLHGKEEYNGFLQSWKNHTDCCELWKGVVCNKTTYHVQQLNLAHLQMNISADPAQLLLYQLSRLPKLTYLDLSYNYINPAVFLNGLANFPALSHIYLGGVSYGIGSSEIHLSKWTEESLQRIKDLDLSNNGIVGRIPSQLANMSNLISLDLSDNEFSSDTISIEYILSRMMKLQLLRLSSMNLNMTTRSLWEHTIANMSDLSLLHLSKCSLSLANIGPKMKWLGKLDKLEELAMDYNNIAAYLPLALANMTRLRALFFSYNKFKGELPGFLGHMQHLRRLYLDGNELNGNFPSFIGNMSLLTEYSVYSNHLTGSIPPSFHLPSNIKHLDIGFNNMKGMISETFFKDAANLKFIDMSSSGLTTNLGSTWIPEFSAEFLSFRSCEIVGTFPTWISTQEEMWHLDLSSNDFQGSVPSWLWDITIGPAYLNLSHNHFEGELHYFGLFAVMDLSFNKFTSLVPLSGNLYQDGIKKTFLDISHNYLEGSLPLSSICSSFPTHLDVSNNRLSGPILHGNCSSLQLLNLDSNYFQGNLPHDFGKGLPSVQWLTMENNQLVGSMPDSLRTCTQLKILNLGNNGFEGEFPLWISELQHLKVLKMSSNRLTGSISGDIGKMRELHFIDLSLNQLSGTIPYSLSNLKAIRQVLHNLSVETVFDDIVNDFGMNIMFNSKGVYTYYNAILNALACIDLSHNELSGRIPAELGKLKGLKQLNLSRNSFTGLIPKSIAELEQLESLDLSSNYLRGTIPLRFTRLSSLGFLNLSYNNLSGVIPRGGQLLTFDSSSFKGNINLKDPLESINQWHEKLPTPAQNDDLSKYNEEELLWGLSVGLSFGVGFAGFIILIIFHKAFNDKIVTVMDSFIQMHIFKNR